MNIKKTAMLAIIPIFFSAIGFLLLILVYCIPTSNQIDKHMKESSLFFISYSKATGLMATDNSQLDYFTDSLMLLTASYPNSSNPIEDAINAPRFELDDDYSPKHAIQNIYSDEYCNYHFTTYARYWHGYLILLKPLLYFFSYGEIRSIMLFIQLLLFTAIVASPTTKENHLILPFICCAIFVNPAVTSLSIQFNTITILTLLMILLVIYLNKQPNITLQKLCVLFSISGCCTSFFDLLTFPLLVLCIPLLFHIAINSQNKNLNSAKHTTILSFTWFWGYSTTWFLKWLLGSLVLKTNVIANGLGQISSRSSNVVNGEQITYWETLVKNIKASYQISWILFLFAIVIFVIIVLCKNKKVVVPQPLIPTIMISLYPFIWYSISKNHSYIHYWYTYRELAVTMFASIMLLMQSIPRRTTSK